jgi:hypothetical protein
MRASRSIDAPEGLSVLRFLFSLTCSLLSGAALALLANVILQSVLSEPSDYPKAVLASSEAHWGADRPADPAQSKPSTEPNQRTKTEVGAANPAIQQAAPSTDVRASEKVTVADVPLATAPTLAPARDAPGAPTQLAPMAAQATLPTNIATPSGDAASVANNPTQIGAAPQGAVRASPISDAASGSPASETLPQPSQGLAVAPPPSPEAQRWAAVVQPNTAIAAPQQQAIVPAQENLAATKPASTGIAAHFSIHYRVGSIKALADAESLAKSLTSSAFDAPKVLTTRHVVQASVVRYFFRQDADVANVAVQELQSGGGTWRTEDCTGYRHKPSAGSIEVWPADVQ